jgi:microcystin-dependent protein
MSNINLSLLITAEAKITAAMAARVEAARAECRRRILAVAAEHTQMNMTGAAAAGLFTAEQQAAYAQAVGWIAAMRGAWPLIAADPEADIADDAEWPACPAEVVALAAAF